MNSFEKVIYRLLFDEFKNISSGLFREMAMIKIISAIFFIIVPCSSQVQLQLWTEVKGTVQGERLGETVTGIKPSANLPYRVAVSRGGNTIFYRLQNPTDTAARLSIIGDNLRLGDLNADGWTDAVVVKRYRQVDTVLVYWGNAGGLDTANPLRIGNEHQSQYLRPQCIGDVNNDGKMDLILSAAYFGLSQGKIYFYFGPNITQSPNMVLLGDTISYHLGRAMISDLNGDGKKDLILGGSVTYPSGNYKYTRIYWGLSDTLILKDPLEIRGLNESGVGWASFDVNGDGINDFLWAACDTAGAASYIKVYFGGAGFNTVPDMILRNPGVGDFANVIADGGDMNGDGYDDIVVGAWRVTMADGLAFIFGGGPKIDGNYDAVVGMDSDADFGYSAASVGDINGDGLSDIIVSAPAWDYIRDKGYWGIFLGDTAMHVTGVKEKNAQPEVCKLYQSYPNPFNPLATIRYDVPTSSWVTLKVYDILGREVATLVNRMESPGYKSVSFDAKSLPTGVYTYRLTAGEYSRVMKMVVVR